MAIIKDNSTFKPYITKYEWSYDCHIQCGSNGLVVSEKPYNTAYFEVFPKKLDCFIRGEGSTIEEAETDAYNLYERYSNCEHHEFEKLPNYKNGMGRCKKCGMKKVVFEQDYTCIICGKHECYSEIDIEYKKNETDCLCKECFNKKENIKYLSIRTLQHRALHFNGFFLHFKNMDEETYQKLKTKPNSIEEFFNILKNDNNYYLYHYIKKLTEESTDLDDVYNYFYENFIEFWVKKERS